MSDKYDEVASLIYFDDDGQGRTSCERIAAILRRAYLATSAQSAEPQEADAPSVDDIDRVEGAVYCYAKLYKEPAAQWSWRRIKSALRARLASEHKDVLHWCGVAGAKTAKIIELEARLASKPSREEEMRECLGWALTYVPLNLTKTEQAMLINARAALDQGGARDEGEGE
jgi:hypothetical protein